MDEQRGSIRLVLGRPRRPADELRDELRRLAGESEPDAVVTFGPWLDEELSPLFGSWPCVHVFDEELSRMPDLAPQTTKARALRRAELVVRRHRLAVPDTVVVISEQEVGYARRRYGSSPAVVVVPQTLPQPQWRPYSDRSAGDSVIAIGNFSEPRNADGLVDFIRVLGARVDLPAELSLVIISGTGFAAGLAVAAASHSWVKLVEGSRDPVTQYRCSRLALVPAGRATGFKATILQAWLCGTPVVASTASAATVEQRNLAASRSRTLPSTWRAWFSASGTTALRSIASRETERPRQKLITTTRACSGRGGNS